MDFADVEDGFALARLSQADDHLPGGDDLPGIGADGGDDPGLVRLQLGIAEVLIGLDELGAGRLVLRGGGLEGLHRLIVFHLGRVAVFQQLALPVFLSSAAVHLGFGRRDLRLGHVDALPVLLRVEPGEQLARLDGGSDIDRALQDLAVDAKTDIGLVAGLDLAGQRHRLAGLARLDGDRAHRPDLRRCGLFLLLAPRQSANQKNDTDRRRKLKRTLKTAARHSRPLATNSPGTGRSMPSSKLRCNIGVSRGGGL